MILRYFYIEEYNNFAEKLNINMGGKYRFNFDEARDRIVVTQDDSYVENLYRKYDVISDISAILGKNSAGKTTVLRVINHIFYNFCYEKKEKYIIVFENKTKYNLYTNFNVALDKKEKDYPIVVYRTTEADLRVILSKVGVIYFSGVFDRATPFIESNNLIDVSTNSEFKEFCRREKLYSGNNDILDAYQSQSILREIDFLISLKTEFKNQNVELLFKTPNEIKIGFIHDWDMIENAKRTLKDRGDLLLLQEISEMAFDYFIETTEENPDLFLEEPLCYFLVDELFARTIKEPYSAENALLFMKDAFINNNWRISTYFDEVLDKLFEYEKDENYDWTEQGSLREESAERYLYEDIIEEINDIINTILDFDDLNIETLRRQINYYLDFFENILLGSKQGIVCELNIIVQKVDELEEELKKQDYDLYSIEILMDICQLLTSIVDDIDENCKGSILQEKVQEDEKDKEDEKEMLQLDKSMQSSYEEEKITKLKKLKNLYIDIEKNAKTKNVDFMLSVKLDSEEILEFIYLFEELDFKLTKIEIQRYDISSGHSAYLDMCSRLNAVRKRVETRKWDNIILLIDEGDIYLHPEMQLKFLNNLLKLLQVLFSNKKIQLIMTSNSPFIVSDIQNANILYLEKNYKEKNKREYIELGRHTDMIRTVSNIVQYTFAANVNDLLRNSFFVEFGLTGEYSIETINEVINILKQGVPAEEYEYIASVINIIGEPLIKRKLMDMLLASKGEISAKKEIEYYKKRIAYLEKHLEPNN